MKYFVLLNNVFLLHPLFWTCIGQKIHGNLLFLSVCGHFLISKKIDCSDTVQHTNLSQIWPFFCHLFLPWKLICHTIQPLVLLPDTLTSASLFTVCSYTLSFACWWWIFIFHVLSNYWYFAIISLTSQLFNICIPKLQQ